MIESADLDELEELARLRDDLPAVSTHILLGSRAALLERASGPARRPLVVRTTRSRFVLGGAFTAAVAAVVAVALTTTGTPPPVAAPPVSAIKVLDLAATAASGTANPVVHPGQLSYVDWIDGPGVDGKAPSREEKQWTPVDGKGDVTTHVRWGDGRTMDNSHRSGACEQVCGHPAPPLYQPTYDYLAALPTDPSALRAVVYQQAQQYLKRLTDGMPANQRTYNIDQQAFELMVSLMTRSYLPPTLRAALYRMTAAIPGITAIGDVVDGAGRHGIGVRRSLDGAGFWITLIFDRSTYQIIGTQENAEDGFLKGALLHSGIVDHVS